MKNEKWLNKKFIVGLSPLDGVTDEPFRLTQVHIAKPDVTFTEFVSAEGLSRGAIKLFDPLLYSSIERPIIGQLFGKDPDSFYIASQILCYLGFDGIDINMGCPARRVTQHGSGAALIEKPGLAIGIIKAVQSGISDFSKSPKLPKLKDKTIEIINRNLLYSHYSLPITNYSLPTLSVKTRLGINQNIATDWVDQLLLQNLDLITLHGRTLKQGYSGTADWESIASCAKLVHQTDTKLFGNGDIQTKQQGIEACQKYGVDGVLIGRAAMGNPWVFCDKTPLPSEKFKVALYHARQFSQIFPNRRLDPLRRHFLLYTAGLPHAKALRNQIVSLTSIDQLCSLEPEFHP